MAFGLSRTAARTAAPDPTLEADIGPTSRDDDEGAASAPLAANAERALIDAARSAPDAFGVLYQAYLPRVYRFLWFRTRNEADAADLTQDVFVRAYAALPRYRSDGVPFAAWLFAIARNRSADAARRSRAANWPLPLPDEAEGDAGPERRVVEREAVERMAVLLTRLDAQTQELVSLRFAAGLSNREIAKVVGRSEASVKQQLVRTLRKLKEQSR